MLTTLRRSLCVTVMLVPPLILAVGAVSRVKSLFVFLNSNARLAGTLSAEATRLLGREVKVSDVEISGNLWSLSSKNVVRLKGVSLEADNGKGNPFVTIKEIVIHYNLDQLLRPARPDIPLIASLHIQNPVATITRDAKGRLNFEGLLKKLQETQGSAGRVLTDRATLSGGSILYSDLAFPAPAGVVSRPFVSRVDGVDGIVNIRPDKSVAFDFSGKGTPQTLQDFHLIGTYSSKPMQIVAFLEGNGVQLSTLSERLISPREGKITAGIANLSSSAIYTFDPEKPFQKFRPEALSLQSTLHLEKLTGTVRNARESISLPFADIVINDSSISANLEMLSAGARVELSAQSLNLNLMDLLDPKKRRLLQPEIVASGKVSSSDLKRLRSALPALDLAGLSKPVRRQIEGANGAIFADFAAKGTPANPAITLRLTSPLLSTPDAKLKELRLSADYRNRTLLASVSAKTLKGELRAKGIYTNDAQGKFTAQAQIRGVEVASLPRPLLQYAPGGINLKDLSGKVSLDANVQGDRKTPPLGTAQVVLRNPSLAGETFRAIYASVESNRQTLLVKNLRVEDERGFLIANGKIGLQDKTLDLNVAANEIDVEGVLAAVQKIVPRISPKAKLNLGLSKVDGFAYLRGQDAPAAKISGTFANPKAVGKITLFDITTDRLDLDKAEVVFDVNRDRLIFPQATAIRAPGYASLSGIVTALFSKEPEISASATLDSLDLNSLLFEAGIKTQGIQITGTVSSDKPILITGTTKDLRLREPALLILEKATFDGIPVRAATALADFRDNKLSLIEANADFLKGHLKASGFVTLRGALDLKASVQDIDLGELDALLPEAVALFEGKIGADLQVTGDRENPVATVLLRGKDLRFSSYRLGNLTGTVSLQDRLVKIDDLKIENPPLVSVPARILELSKLSYDLDSHELMGDGKWEGVTQLGARSLLQAILDANASNTYFRDQLTLMMGQLSPFASDNSVFPLYVAVQRSSRNPLQILQTALRLTETLETNLSGNFSLGGSSESPRLAVNWNDIPVRIGGFDLTLKKNTAVVTKKFVDAPEIEISAQDGDLIARNTHVEFGGDIRSDIDGYNINLAPFASLFLRPGDPQLGEYSLSGTGTLGLILRGKTVSPEIEQASVNLADIVLRRRLTSETPTTPTAGTLTGVTPTDQSVLFKINRADINNITLKDGIIQTDDLRLTVNNTVVRGNAKVSDFTWSPPFLPESAPVQVFANLLPKNTDDKNLQELATLFPGILSAQSNGAISLRTQILGTRANPFASILGTLEVKAPLLQVNALSTGLRDVDALLEFDGDLMKVNHFAAFSTGAQPKSNSKNPEPNVILTGSLPLNDSSKARHPEAKGIDLSAKSVFVRSINLENKTDASAASVVLNGTIDSLLKVSNTLIAPNISGTTTVSNARVAIPGALGVSAPASTKSGFNPTFNSLRLVLGDNVRVSNVLLDTQVGGEVTLDGSLNEPRLNGNLELLGGKLTLTTTRLTIRRPSTLTVAYPVYNSGVPGLGLNVNLRAEGTIPVRSGFGGTTRDRVSLQVVGPLTGEVVDPTTNQSRLQIISNDPRIDKATLFRTLALGDPDALDGLGTNPGSVLAQRLTNVFTGALLPRLFDGAAQSLGFDEFALGYDPVQNFNLNLSRRLFGPFYISYQRSLSSLREQYTFRLSVRFSERFQTSYEVRETNEQRFLFEGVFRF